MTPVAKIRSIEWTLGALTTALAVAAWLQRYQPAHNTLTIYDVFPLLGLIAFGLMWTHFIIGALSRLMNVSYEQGYYSLVTMGLVLALIILHPSLLVYALYRDGFGLPPGSFMQVYGADIIAIFVAEISLAIFLAYELKRKFAASSWWKYVEWAQGVAMIGIFYHSLTLGSTMQIAWFKAVWWLYGITLVMTIIYAWLATNKKEVRNES